jgi:hypothetical protein
LAAFASASSIAATSAILAICATASSALSFAFGLLDAPFVVKDVAFFFSEARQVLLELPWPVMVVVVVAAAVGGLSSPW